MCGPAAPIIAAVATAVSTVHQIRQAKKADKRSKEANKIAEKNAADALKQQQDDNARRNKKQPNVAAILSTNKNKQVNETALSGAGGVDASQLQLGGNTLLGQ